MTNITPPFSKYKISRRGRKLQVSDDQRTLVALPRDVPERTWAEILQKEENDLLVFDIREEIVEAALQIGYQEYMEKQTAVFTVHCVTEAWLKLINWHFYRHDPGEETSAYPPCYIPKREESWIPDERPDPSPKDTWGKHSLHVVEDTPDTVLQKWPSSSSLDLPVVEEISSEYWFPGKINVPSYMRRVVKKSFEVNKTGAWSKVNSIPLHYAGNCDCLIQGACKSLKNPLMVIHMGKGGLWDYVQDSDSGSRATTEDLNTESEVLQKVTDYSTEGLSGKDSSSTYGELKTTTPADDESVQGPLHGAGDSAVAMRPKRREKSKSFSRTFGKSKATLPPLDQRDSRSRISIISDCRLRNLRLETQYEITSEKVDTPPGETTKRK